MVGSIALFRERMQDIPRAARAQSLLEVVRKKGLGILPWSSKPAAMAREDNAVTSQCQTGYGKPVAGCV